MSSERKEERERGLVERRDTLFDWIEQVRGLIANIDAGKTHAPPFVRAELDEMLSSYLRGAAICDEALREIHGLSRRRP